MRFSTGFVWIIYAFYIAISDGGSASEYKLSAARPADGGGGADKTTAGTLRACDRDPGPGDSRDLWRARAKRRPAAIVGGRHRRDHHLHIHTYVHKRDFAKR